MRMGSKDAVLVKTIDVHRSISYQKVFQNHSMSESLRVLRFLGKRL